MVRRQGGLSGEDQSLGREVALSSTVDGRSSCSTGVCHVGYFNQTPDVQAGFQRAEEPESKFPASIVL